MGINEKPYKTMYWFRLGSCVFKLGLVGVIMIHRKQMVEFADILVMFYNSGKKAIEIPEIEKEIAHILNKNSIRFNPYRFKNYILARIKKADTTTK